MYAPSGLARTNSLYKTTVLSAALTIGLFAGSSVASELSQENEQILDNLLTLSHTHQTVDEEKLLRQLRSAAAEFDLDGGSTIFEDLKNSSNSETLLELAKLRFDRANPFYDETAGLALIDRIIASDAPLKGNAAALAGSHYRSSTTLAGREQAIGWFEKATDWGVERAHIPLANLLARQPDGLIRALHHYDEAARLVSSAPVISFARKVLKLVDQGERCDVDPYEIADQYLPSLATEAAAGKLRAMKELGRLHFKGIFVDQDIDEAAKWLSQAARTGDAGALRDMAKVHLKLSKSPQSVEKAIGLLELSGSKGNGGAYATLAKLYLRKDEPRFDAQAFLMYKKSIDAGFEGGVADLRKTYEGELDRQDNPDRIRRLAKMLQEITPSLLAYTPPSPSADGNEIGQLPGGDPIDTIQVGSIPTANQNSPEPTILLAGNEIICNMN